MTKKIRKPNVRDVALQLEVLIEDAGWQAKFPRLQKKLVAAIEAALLSQHKLKLKSGAYELSLVLTSNDKIKKLNRDHRGKDYATNVLSFPMIDDQITLPGMPVMLGDIVIAHDVVATEAKAERKTFPHHAMHMAVHGLLHLCGYDHETPGMARTMEKLERAILAKLGVPNPYLN
jgi:probable rRNA maturation factor